LVPEVVKTQYRRSKIMRNVARGNHANYTTVLINLFCGKNIPYCNY